MRDSRRSSASAAYSLPRVMPMPSQPSQPIDDPDSIDNNKKKIGYNQVIGNGTVVGTAFLGKPNMKAAGDPQTPTNP